MCHQTESGLIAEDNEFHFKYDQVFPYSKPIVSNDALSGVPQDEDGMKTIFDVLIDIDPSPANQTIGSQPLCWGKPISKGW